MYLCNMPNDIFLPLQPTFHVSTNSVVQNVWKRRPQVNASCTVINSFTAVELAATVEVSEADELSGNSVWPVNHAALICD